MNQRNLCGKSRSDKGKFSDKENKKDNIHKNSYAINVHEIGFLKKY